MDTLLVIGYVWPEPKSSAAGSHMLSIIRLFRQANWKVLFSTPAQKTDFCLELKQENIETKEIQVNSETFDHFISELKPTAVLFDRFLMEEQFAWRVEKYSPASLRILDTEDLQCLRGARQLALKENREFNKNDLHSDLSKREIASIYRCDLSLIISDFEIELLTEHFSIDPSLLLHVPFMLDLNRKPKNLPSFEQRKHFVTIGNLRHAPNWDSILFLQEIWPLIRKQLPKAELHIYGAYTPPKATALNNPKIGFLIKDRAVDVNQVMANARVCLSPLRFGAGIKGKFVDAMMNQTPIITTDIGAEGMTGQKIHESYWPGYVEGDINSIVSKSVELYNNEQKWNEKSQHAHELLNRVFDGGKIGLKLIDRVNELILNIKQHRIDNFIGSMLSHHTMRSTEFMARWIEEKNK
ncbi:MAG: glycosyltransferase involved in cell wall biosynthesis [Polaribacter sp.]|jgi:glycosyltransferase involved in cell wall biosynthesis